MAGKDGQGRASVWLRRGMVGLALVGLAAWLGRDWIIGPQVGTVSLAPTELVRTLVASGRVETPQRVAIGSQVTATVTAVPVAEGQSVTAGQVLVQLEGSEARAALEQARAAVVQAEARFAQLRELGLPAAQQAVRQAEVTAGNAQRQYERLAQLRRENFIGQAQLDDAQRARDLAESQLRSARLQAASNEGRGADVRLAESGLAQARAAQVATEARLAYTVIRAPVAGVLIARAVERGDVVQPGKVLMQLSPAGATRLVAQIDERNLSLVRLGQKALASADAYPARRFEVVLGYINPGVDATRGSVQAKFDVPAPPDFLRQDMTVSIEVEVERKPGALIVPEEALVFDAAASASGSAAPTVFKAIDGQARRQPVRIGIRQAGKVEILEGLASGDVVIVGAPALREGQRVRTRAWNPPPASAAPAPKTSGTGMP